MILFHFIFIFFRYSIRSDVWAVGITMYEIITLQKPFGLKGERINEKLICGEYPQIIDSERLYNKEMIRLINSLLTVYCYFLL
jgi:serine/threonine protein kinase